MKLIFKLKLTVSIYILIISASLSAQTPDYKELMLNSKCLTYIPQEQKSKVKDKLMVINPRKNGLQCKLESNSAKFMIHYDTSGVNAVQKIDSNKNGIPDYVDSVSYYFDYVYNEYINKMGYLSPYPEDVGGGSAHYDVYLIELGIGNYGETSYGFTEAEYEILPRRNFPRYNTFILIDNNFSPTDST